MVAAARRHSKKVAYVRVSSVDQNPERQLESIASEQPDKTFTDKCSGKDTKRAHSLRQCFPTCVKGTRSSFTRWIGWDVT
jgi:DNA invertase Pin-like site-specific DNA recombinase